MSSEQRSGAVTFIDITAEHGGLLTLQSPWASRAVSADDHLLTPDANGQLHIDFSPGAHHHLAPASDRLDNKGK